MLYTICWRKCTLSCKYFEWTKSTNFVNFFQIMVLAMPIGASDYVVNCWEVAWILLKKYLYRLFALAVSLLLERSFNLRVRSSVARQLARAGQNPWVHSIATRHSARARWQSESLLISCSIVSSSWTQPVSLLDTRSTLSSSGMATWEFAH